MEFRKRTFMIYQIFPYIGKKTLISNSMKGNYPQLLPLQDLKKLKLSRMHNLNKRLNQCLKKLLSKDKKLHLLIGGMREELKLRVYHSK